MKKWIYLMVILIPGFLAACKKDSPDNDAPFKEISAKLQGVWHNEKQVWTRYENDKEIARDEQIMSPGDFTVEFVSDSVFFSTDGRPEDRYKYSITDGEINFREGNGTQHMRFKLIDDTRFIMFQEEVETRPSGVLRKDVEEYHFKKNK